MSTQQGVIVGKDTITLEANIIDKLVEIGFEKDYVVKCLQNNRHNNATTTYYLIKN